MLTVPTIRNIVCPISIPPTGFPIQDFAQKLELGPVEQQIQVSQYALWEYQDLRLQVLPDRLQLGFRETASSESVRAAAEEFISLMRERFGIEELGFNANLRIRLEEDENKDPTTGIFPAGKIVARLGGANPRGGIWLMYEDDESNWWIELIPDLTEPDWWVFSIQRNFSPFPDDEAKRTGVLEWFADSATHLLEQCKVVMGIEDGDDS